jgi:hypothetical protein
MSDDLSGAEPLSQSSDAGDSGGSTFTTPGGDSYSVGDVTLTPNESTPATGFFDGLARGFVDGFVAVPKFIGDAINTTGDKVNAYANGVTEGAGIPAPSPDSPVGKVLGVTVPATPQNIATNQAGKDAGANAPLPVKQLGTLLKVITSPWFYVPAAGLVVLGILSPYLSPLLRRV